VVTTNAKGTTRSTGGRAQRPVTSGVAYNCSATQFLVPGVASSSALKRFGSGNIASPSCVLRLSRKYARNIMFYGIFTKKRNIQTNKSGYFCAIVQLIFSII